MKIRIVDPVKFRELVERAASIPRPLNKNFHEIGNIDKYPIYLVKDAIDVMEEDMGAREYEDNFSVTCFYFLDTTREIILIPGMTSDPFIGTFHYFDSTFKNAHPFKKNRSHEEYITDYINEALRDYDLQVELVDDKERNSIYKEKDKIDVVHQARLLIQI